MALGILLLLGLITLVTTIGTSTSYQYLASQQLRFVTVQIILKCYVLTVKQYQICPTLDYHGFQMVHFPCRFYIEICGCSKIILKCYVLAAKQYYICPTLDYHGLQMVHFPCRFYIPLIQSTSQLVLASDQQFRAVTDDRLTSRYPLFREDLKSSVLGFTSENNGK